MTDDGDEPPELADVDSDRDRGLAAERTDLAWGRSTLALFACGAAVAKGVPNITDGSRPGAGIVMLLLGGAVWLAGLPFARLRANGVLDARWRGRPSWHHSRSVRRWSERRPSPSGCCSLADARDLSHLDGWYPMSRPPGVPGWSAMSMKRFLSPVLVGALFVGLSACGSDDKSSDATESVAGDSDGDVVTDETDEAAESVDVPVATDAVTDETDPSAAGAPDTGSPFCLAAEAAKTAGNAVDLDNGTPAEIEAGVTASVEAAKAAVEVAPDEIKDVIAQVASYQEQFGEILAQYDWDLAQAAAAPEFAELASTDVDGISAQLSEYLLEHCGLVS